MTTALIVFLNVFFIAFVLVTVLGLLAWGIVSDRTITASIADQRARLRTAFHRAPRARRRRRAGSPAAPSTSARKSAPAGGRFGQGRRAFGRGGPFCCRRTGLLSAGRSVPWRD